MAVASQRPDHVQQRLFPVDDLKQERRKKMLGQELPCPADSQSTYEDGEEGGVGDEAQVAKHQVDHLRVGADLADAALERARVARNDQDVQTFQ